VVLKLGVASAEVYRFENYLGAARGGELALVVGGTDLLVP